MLTKDSQPRVERLADGSPDWMAALHLAMDLRPETNGMPAPAVEQLVGAAKQGRHSLDLFFAAYNGFRLLSAVIAAVSKGSCGLVFFPRNLEDQTCFDGTCAAMRRLLGAAGRQPVRLLEALTAPGAGLQGVVLRETGFRRITRLRYLRRRVPSTIRPHVSATGLDWVSYSDSARPLFERTLVATYAQTVDCPELSGIRTPAEVLTGHQGTGVFDPALWWIARRGGQPAGVLLLSRLASRPALEIAYMGVAQPFRGQGLAHALLSRAVGEAERDSAKELTLAVDERNGPARRLYSRWGFTEFAQRDAWIATPVAS